MLLELVILLTQLTEEMETYDTRPHVKLYLHLPDYARFLLEHHLEDYIHFQLRLSRELNLPMMRHLSHMGERELIEFSISSTKEFFYCLIENKADDFINASAEQWLTNQLEIIGRHQIEARDITYVHYIRGKALKKWIFEYTTDNHKAFALGQEIDNLLMRSNTKLFETYVEILKEEIGKEAHFNKQVTQTTPGIIYVYDLVSHTRFFANEKMQQMLGYSNEDFRQKDENELAELIHPEDRERWGRHFNDFHTVQEGEVRFIEYRMKDAKGEYKWLRNYDSVFKRDSKQVPVQIIGVTFDITAEKKVSNQLKESQEQLLEAQTITKIASFEWNFTEHYTKNSPQVYEIFEMPVGTKYEEFMQSVHPDDRGKLENVWKRALETGLYECEYRYLAHGKEKYIWAKGYIDYRDSKPYKMIGTIQDISDRKKVEDSLLQKTLELERSNSNLRDFASVASHDLKEPLRKITAFTDRVLTSEQEVLSEDGRKSLEKVVAAAQRMRSLIDNILAFSSLEEGPQKQVCSLQDIFNGVLATLEHQILEKGATVSSDALPEAEIIPFQMQQLFQNLISNALKFAKRDVPPVVSVTHRVLPAKEVDLTKAISAPQYLELRVADNGIGFGQEARLKIFELFQRLHSKQDYDGTGLGLSICKKIAENHGGYIYADSIPNQGSVFSIVIPTGEKGVGERER